MEVPETGPTISVQIWLSDPRQATPHSRLWPDFTQRIHRCSYGGPRMGSGLSPGSELQWRWDDHRPQNGYVVEDSAGTELALLKLSRFHVLREIAIGSVSYEFHQHSFRREHTLTDPNGSVATLRLWTLRKPARITLNDGRWLCCSGYGKGRKASMSVADRNQREALRLSWSPTGRFPRKGGQALVGELELGEELLLVTCLAIKAFGDWSNRGGGS